MITPLMPPLLDYDAAVYFLRFRRQRPLELPCVRM